MSYPAGEFVHGEYSGVADATGADITLYSSEGCERTLLATERLIVHSYHMVVAAATTANIFADKDAGNDLDAGEMIAGGTFDANSGLAETGIEHACPLGTAPKVRTTAGVSVVVVLRGEIVKG